MKTPELLYHPQTKDLLVALAKNPPQGMLFLGSHGVGKLSCAYAWSYMVTRQRVQPLTLSPDEKGTISIESVRELYSLVRGKQTIQQVVVIDHADAMSNEAQNALLKLLEEPRQGVTFILTAPQQQSILPTIASRLQVVHIHPLPTQQLQTYLTKEHPTLSPTEKTQLLFIANGRPGILHTLLTTPKEKKEQLELMQLAKQLLSAPRFERLKYIPTLASDRPYTTNLLEAMQRMAGLQLKQAPSPKLLALAEQLETTLTSLAKNGNIRIHLLSLFSSY